MKGAFNTQTATFDPDVEPWKQVRGPTTAMLATLARLKWFPAGCDKWITDDDEIIDLN